MRKASGERVGIGYDDKRKLAVSTAGDQTRIEALLYQHTVDQAMNHLSKSGMNLKAAKLSNGELQFFSPGSHQRETGFKGRSVRQVPWTAQFGWMLIKCKETAVKRSFPACAGCRRGRN